MESASIPKIPSSRDNTYLQQHGILELVDQLTAELSEHKPVNYLEFMVQWLGNITTGGGGNRPPFVGGMLGAVKTPLSHYDCSCGGGGGGGGETTTVNDEGRKSPHLAVFAPVREIELKIEREIPSGVVVVGDGGRAPRVSERATQNKDTFVEDFSVETFRSWNTSFPQTPKRERRSLRHVEQEVLPPSMGQLLNVVRRLPSSEHTAALVFLEGLLDKKNASINFMNKPPSSEGSPGITTHRESNEPRSDAVLRSTASLHSLLTSNGLHENQLASAHLQDVINDALTGIIFSREQVNGEEGLEEASHGSPKGISTPHRGHLYGQRKSTSEDALTQHLDMTLVDTKGSLFDDTPLPLTYKDSSMGLPAMESFHSSFSKVFSGTQDEMNVEIAKHTDAHEEELNAARESIAAYDLFHGCNETQMECVLRSMVRCVLSSGELCMCEDKLVFVCSGTLALECENRKLRHLSPGEYFGWLDRMRDAELHGTTCLRALSDVVLLYINLEDFRVVEDNEKDVRRSMFVMLIKQSPSLSPVSPSDCRRLASSFRVRNFKKGSVIMHRGEQVEWFSLIMSGAVRRVLYENSEPAGASKGCGGESTDGQNAACEISVDLTPGCVIGDLELLFHSELLLDAVAMTNVTVARLHMVYFQSIVPRHSMEDMKYIAIKAPANVLLASWFPNELRQEVEQVARRDSDLFKRRGSFHEAKRISFSQGSNITSSRRATGVASEGKSCLRVRRRRVRSTGEIVYAGKRNLYRFPLCAIEACNTIMITLVLDGTVIRWNQVVDRVTGFHQHNVLGQSIFSFIATEAGRENMRNQLLQAQKFAGNWNGYVAAGLSSPRVYRFRQASALYHVNLLLSVIPSSIESSGDVMLLVGRKENNHVGESYMEDAVQWMNDVLWPQLRAFQKRVEILEAKKWEVSPEDGKRLHGHMEACNQLMKYYLQLSSLNMESMNELWKPVRLPHVMQKFTWEVLPLVHNAGNRFSSTFDEALPKEEVFLHVEHMLGVLRRLVCGVNEIGSGISIHVEVGVVQRTSSSLPSSSFSAVPPYAGHQSIHTVDTERRANIVIHSPTTQPSALTTESSGGVVGTIGGVNNALGMENNVWLCSTTPHRQAIDKLVSFSMRHIHITVKDNAKCHDNVCGDPHKDERTITAVSRSPSPTRNESPDRHSNRRAMILKECEGLVATMGGNLTSHTSPSAEMCNIVRVELPLLPAPWADDGDKGVDSSVPIASRSLTVVVADRDAKKRNNLCQLMWARRHAVVPVTSFSDVLKKVESGGADILVIDPRYLEATSEEFAALKNGTSPLDALRYQMRLVVVLYADDFNDWRAQKLMECTHVIELPKPASAALLHFALHEAERVVACMREDEERIAQLRMAFTQFQRDRYKVERLIGRGAFGEVYEVEDSLTGGKLAMKRMHLNQGVLADEVAQELLAMTSLQHENIIHYFYCQKESDTRLRIYMELASGGTLQEKIRRHGGPLPVEAIVQHLQDLCRGLAYLHSKNYIHGDIKTANALIDQHGRTKIGDFGTAKQLKRPGEKMYRMVGTPQFMAPELMNADASQRIGYNQKADIWSLGCVALELATGMPPFSFMECTHGMGIFFYVSGLHDTPDLSPISGENPLVYSFVKCCLNVDPEKRPTAEELLLHELLQGAGKSTRNERILRKVEMLETLNHYSAFDHPSDDDDDDDDEEEEEEEEEDSSSESTIVVRRGRGVKTINKLSTIGEESDASRWKGIKSRREHLLEKERIFFSSSPSSSPSSSSSRDNESNV